MPYTKPKTIARLGGRLHVLQQGRWVCMQVVEMERTVATGAERVLVEHPDTHAEEWFPLDACASCSCMPQVKVKVRTP